MSKIRVNRNKNYVTMSNFHLKEKEMSLKAKGLLSVMLSLPDDWNYSIQGLVAICKENETSIKSTLEELKNFGYLVVTKLLPNETSNGRIEYVYDIYEKPISKKQEGEKQGVENLGVEFLGVENQGQLNNINNKELIIKELNNNNNNNNLLLLNRIHKLESELNKYINNNKPTLEEIKEYAQFIKSEVDYEYFFNYYEANKWLDKNGEPIENWKLAFLSWEKNEKEKKKKSEDENKPTNCEYVYNKDGSVGGLYLNPRT